MVMKETLFVKTQIDSNIYNHLSKNISYLVSNILISLVVIIVTLHGETTHNPKTDQKHPFFSPK